MLLTHLVDVSFNRPIVLRLCQRHLLSEIKDTRSACSPLRNHVLVSSRPYVQADTAGRARLLCGSEIIQL